MKKYRKKPVVIEAVQYNGNNSEMVLSWMFPSIKPEARSPTEQFERIQKEMGIEVGDWVIEGIESEFWFYSKYYSLCKPDIFEATYEAVDEDCKPPKRRMVM